MRSLCVWMPDPRTRSHVAFDVLLKLSLSLKIGWQMLLRLMASLGSLSEASEAALHVTSVVVVVVISSTILTYVFREKRARVTSSLVRHVF